MRQDRTNTNQSNGKCRNGGSFIESRHIVGASEIYVEIFFLVVMNVSTWL